MGFLAWGRFPSSRLRLYTAVVENLLWFNREVSLLDLPVEQVASSPPSLLSVAVAAGVSLIFFWLGYRQRKAIEDWFRALSKWVDDPGEPLRAPEYNYNLLTSREIIELSLPRRHRFLAWWMHEMAVAVMDRRLAASKSLESREKCGSDLNQLLRETGGRLLEWHHRKLKSSDFHVPYQLRAAARSAGAVAWATDALQGFDTPAGHSNNGRARSWAVPPRFRPPAWLRRSGHSLSIDLELP